LSYSLCFQIVSRTVIFIVPLLFIFLNCNLSLVSQLLLFDFLSLMSQIFLYNIIIFFTDVGISSFILITTFRKRFFLYTLAINVLEQDVSNFVSLDYKKTYLIEIWYFVKVALLTFFSAIIIYCFV
jgi:hypothetical protein